MDVELKDGIHPVGRDQENAIVIVDPSVSARHARLTSRPDGWYGEDLKSSNGTFVNHRPASYSKLNSGDVLRFGKIETEFLDDELTLEATSTTFLSRKHWRIIVTWSSVKIVPKSQGKAIEIPFREASRMIVMNESADFSYHCEAGGWPGSETHLVSRSMEESNRGFALDRHDFSLGGEAP